MFISLRLTAFRIQTDRSVHDPTHTALETCQADSPTARAGPPSFPGDSNKAPTPLTPSPGSGLTYLPHFTHSSTNMFPWSSANLSLREKRQR